jgi:hypothetical protein
MPMHSLASVIEKKNRLLRMHVVRLRVSNQVKKVIMQFSAKWNTTIDIEREK